MTTSKTLSNAADVAFRTIERKTTRKATRTRKAKEISQDKIERALLFVKAVQNHTNPETVPTYKATDGSDRFDRDEAIGLGKAIASTLKVLGVFTVGLKIAPAGRTENGNVEYGIAGYVKRERIVPSYGRM